MINRAPEIGAMPKARQATRRQKSRRPPMFGRLLVRIGHADELLFTVGTAYKDQSRRHATDKTDRHIYFRIPRLRSWGGSDSRNVIAIDLINLARDRSSGHNQCIEPVLSHDCINAVLARRSLTLGDGTDIFRVR